MTVPAAARNPLRRAVVIGALGVVYGDIGTSPIYTFRECLKAAGEAGTEAVLGLLSLVFWALMVVVTLKYVCFVMRADNDGEGGIIALGGLAASAERDERRRRWLVLIGLAGAALFYGDGMITPAISVLSAVEGLEVATPLLKPYVVPLTVIVLVGLFLFQSRGSARIGARWHCGVAPAPPIAVLARARPSPSGTQSGVRTLLAPSLVLRFPRS